MEIVSDPRSVSSVLSNPTDGRSGDVVMTDVGLAGTFHASSGYRTQRPSKTLSFPLSPFVTFSFQSAIPAFWARIAKEVEIVFDWDNGAPELVWVPAEDDSGLIR